jgi:hypothetical protein
MRREMAAKQRRSALTCRIGALLASYSLKNEAATLALARFAAIA